MLLCEWETYTAKSDVCIHYVAVLAWLNELVKGDYSRVEQCANGAAYCQIMDALYQVTISSSLIGARATCYLIMDAHDQVMMTSALENVHQNRSVQTRFSRMTP